MVLSRALSRHRGKKRFLRWKSRGDGQCLLFQVFGSFGKREESNNVDH
jgi:hypothetical protein